MTAVGNSICPWYFRYTYSSKGYCIPIMFGQMTRSVMINMINHNGGGVERDQISDIIPPKKSNIRYQTPKKIKYQISDPKKNQISDITHLQKSDIWL